MQSQDTGATYSTRTSSLSRSFHRAPDLPQLSQPTVGVKQEVEHRSPDSFGVSSWERKRCRSGKLRTCSKQQHIWWITTLESFPTGWSCTAWSQLQLAGNNFGQSPQVHDPPKANRAWSQVGPASEGPVVKTLGREGTTRSIYLWGKLFWPMHISLALPPHIPARLTFFTPLFTKVCVQWVVERGDDKMV